MIPKSETLVLDAKKQVIRCEICKVEYPLADYLPSPITKFLKKIKALTKLHVKCSQAKRGAL